MFDRVTPDMQSYKDDILTGLQVVRADGRGSRPPAERAPIWQWRGLFTAMVWQHANLLRR